MVVKLFDFIGDFTITTKKKVCILGTGHSPRVPPLHHLLKLLKMNEEAMELEFEEIDQSWKSYEIIMTFRFSLRGLPLC